MGRRSGIAGLALALLAALVAGGALTDAGYYDSHDGLLNVHRLYELERCVEDGQLPCRWVPDMGRGYGYPLFNFYPPLSSHVALAARGLGAGTLSAVKWAMGLALAVAAAGMFVLTRRFLGPTPAAVGAVLYTLAPYVAVDVYVRGALAETWGLALLPWVFSCGERAARGARGGGLACSLAWALLLLAHPLTALMASVPYGLWLGAWLWRTDEATRPRALLELTLAHALALGLAAWFAIPSLVELEQVHAGTLTSLYPWARYENNFLSPGELFAFWPAWGYGPFRSEGGMALFLGPVQAVAALAAGVGLVRAARRGPLDDAGHAAALQVGIAAFAAAMTLALSRPLWDAVPALSWLQFPWRFLALASLGAAFAGAWLSAALAARARAGAAFTAALCVAGVATSWVWFQPKAMHEVEGTKLANRREVAKAVHGLFDFLPAGVDLDRFRERLPPIAPPPATSRVATIRDAVRSSDRIELQVTVPGDVPAVVRIESYAFPGWQVEIDGEPAELLSKDEGADEDDRVARLHVRVPPGEHRVVAHFRDTPVRRAANGVSLASLAAWIGWGIWDFRSLRLRRRPRAE